METFPPFQEGGHLSAGTGVFYLSLSLSGVDVENIHVFAIRMHGARVQDSPSCARREPCTLWRSRGGGETSQVVQW